MVRRKFGLVAAATIGLALGASGCSGSGAVETPVAEGTAIVATTAATEAPLNLTGEDASTAADVADETPATPAPVMQTPEPTPSDTRPLPEFDIDALPTPSIVGTLPAGLPTATPTDALGEVALPYQMLTPGYATPDEYTAPVLALSAKTDLGSGGEGAGWAVVGQEPGWVEVLVPVGRGSLPSQDPSDVNHHAVWVRSDAVEVDPLPQRIVVNVDQHTLTVYDGDQELGTVHVGVGIEGKTPTPRGLCAVSGHITTQAGASGLITSCQSETLDGFKQEPFAATAIHQGSGFKISTGAFISNGCVRVPPEKYNELLADIPTGTVVVFE